MVRKRESELQAAPDIFTIPSLITHKGDAESVLQYLRCFSFTLLRLLVSLCLFHFHQSVIRFWCCSFFFNFLQRSLHGKYQKFCSRILPLLSHIQTSDFGTLLGWCLISLTIYTKQTYIFAVRCC